MKHFPFKILFLCIFLPPICYILTVQGLNGYLQKRETAKLNQILIRNHDALLEGRYTLKEEIDRNLKAYLRPSLKSRLGIGVRVLVKTRDDRILYPAQFKEERQDPAQAEEFSRLPLESLHYMEVAAENYKTLNDGLVLEVDVEIRHNSWLSNSILILYVFVSLLILRRFIRKGFMETERIEQEQRRHLEALSGELKEAENRLCEVESKEENYLARIRELSQGKQDLSKDVEGLLDEMEKLETGLEEQRDLKEGMELEVLQLKEELDRMREKLRKPKQKKKKTDALHKRFAVLYKNLVLTDRAMEGFLSLTDEFQLKAEEIMHNLNEDESQISVKRKVFGKGGKMNILEADFFYSGRIYFQKDSQSRIRIVAIGTKNTQQRDLAYLESIR